VTVPTLCVLLRSRLRQAALAPIRFDCPRCHAFIDVAKLTPHMEGSIDFACSKCKRLHGYAQCPRVCGSMLWRATLLSMVSGTQCPVTPCANTAPSRDACEHTWRVDVGFLKSDCCQGYDSRQPVWVPVAYRAAAPWYLFIQRLATTGVFT
jgi:hypothetical protein